MVWTSIFQAHLDCVTPGVIRLGFISPNSSPSEDFVFANRCLGMYASGFQPR